MKIDYAVERMLKGEQPGSLKTDTERETIYELSVWGWRFMLSIAKNTT